MAEAPEHSTTLGEPAPTATEPVLGLPGGERAEPYRPVSLLAVGGLSLAVVYAVSVTLGGLAVFASRYGTAFKLLLLLIPAGAVLTAVLRGETKRIVPFIGMALAGTATVLGLGSLVAFSGSNPWLLPNAMWLVVIAAGLISWVARIRIQGSENTLSGSSLAGWGIGLSLFFGINYAAYQASTILAVRGQARQAAEEYLQKIRDGNLPEAFIMTLPPNARPAVGTDLLDLIEVQYNTPLGSSQRDSMGAYSKFCTSDLTRLIALGGTDTKLEPSNVNYEFEKGIYTVAMGYKLSNQFGSFDATVTTKGREASDGKGRREWLIDSSTTGINQPRSQTDAGKQLESATGAAQRSATEWLSNLQNGNLDEAYLATVSPEKREAQREALAGKAMKSPAGQAFRDGKKTFMKGDLLDFKEMWTGSPKYRRAIPVEMHKIFDGSIKVPLDMGLLPVRFPTTKLRDKRIFVAVPCRILIPDPFAPGFQLEGEVVVDVPLSDNPPPLSDLRIDSLRLLRGRSAPKRGPQQQRR